MAFNFKTQAGAQEERVFLNGRIDEDAEAPLKDLSPQIVKNVIFNFKNVDAVNSCGVRVWINFLREIEKKTKVRFEECAAVIVSQMNMIPNFMGHAEIISVYGNFCCESCGAKKAVLFKSGENLPKSPGEALDMISCSECSQPMELEELPEEFFDWMNR